METWSSDKRGVSMAFFIYIPPSKPSFMGAKVSLAFAPHFKKEFHK